MYFPLPSSILGHRRERVADIEAFDLLEAEHVVNEIGKFDAGVIAFKAYAALPQRSHGPGHLSKDMFHS